jgi:hypothetical protein
MVETLYIRGLVQQGEFSDMDAMRALTRDPSFSSHPLYVNSAVC